LVGVVEAAKKGGGCGGYVGGKSALDHYHEGFFGSPNVTTWTRGQPAEVFWNSHANHRGGYAFRLCKVQNHKVWHVTEECFQEGHLKFHGNEQWLYWHPDDEGYHEEGWMPVRTVKVSQGTTPAHSEWAMINLPTHTGDGNEWAWKDLVEVPEDLEPGEYVLSFRWDCLHSPQVWNSCSNIVIV